LIRTEGRSLPFSTLYAGGGTPTLLPPEFWHRMIGIAQSPFLQEITIETNPAVLDGLGYSTLLLAGFNRISLGIQSFSESALKKLGRIHSAEEARAAMKQIRDTGFRNISTDLIYGHPDQTLMEQRSDLEELLHFMPQHISLYDLTLEKGTPMGDAGKKVSDELCADMYHQADRLLSENGYIHYEVSSYALEEKYISQHNSSYWKRIPYIGIGPSAHSFTGSARTWNFSDSRQYESAVIRGESPTESGEDLTAENHAHEVLALGFRHTGGVNLDELRGNGFSLNPEKLLSTGMVTRKGNLLIPDSVGMLFADSLALKAAELLEELPRV
jgi:oxygen-independent coproporphyrinogen-3 oxidase